MPSDDQVTSSNMSDEIPSYIAALEVLSREHYTDDP